MSYSAWWLFALAASAVSANDCSQDYDIISQDGINDISQCARMSGNIRVASTNLTTLHLPNLTVLHGDLFIKDNDYLKSVELPRLLRLNGALALFKNGVLETLDTPALTYLRSLEAVDNPQLKNVGFPAELRDIDLLRLVGSRVIKLGGIKPQGVGSIEIVDNPEMDTISFNHLVKVHSSLRIANNHETCSLHLPSLTNIGRGLELAHLRIVKAPRLESVGGGVHVHDNWFEEIELDDLTEVEESVRLHNNSQLRAFSLRALERVGGSLVVYNNTQLESIADLDELETVNGDINIRGSFRTLSMLQLEQTAGRIIIKSTERLDCKDIKKNLAIKPASDKWVCQEEVDRNEVIALAESDQSGGKNGAVQPTPGWSMGIALGVTGLMSIVQFLF
ncbi:protoplasts-secreted [Dimargaris cristalligena]|nr:protoplasts-secreted [Dimargaris cristalligena]